MEKVTTYRNKEMVGNFLERASLPKLRNDFIAKLENALMFLDYKTLNMWYSEAKNNVSLQSFDGVWLLDVSLRHGKEDGFTFKPFGDFQVTPDMFPNLNLKWLNLSGEIGAMCKYRFLNTKEKRHLDTYKYIFSERLAVLDYGNQKWWTNEDGYGFNNMKSYEDANIIIPIPTSLKQGYIINKHAANKRVLDGMNGNDDNYLHTIKGIHMALQLALTYDYEWSCYIKETPNSLGVRIPIHPSSSKEVFIMRNIPEGSQRKKAIINFVKDHYRTIKNVRGDETKILIKKHFRGELKFKWRGLEVIVTPSPYDIRTYKSSKKFLKI